MSQFSICRKSGCATRVEGNVARCPACNGTMVNSSWLKSTGWILAVVGGLIGVPMVFVILKFLPVVMDPAGAVAEGRFGGTAEQVPMAMGLLLLTLTLGMAMLGFGLQRAIAGKRSALAKPVILGLGVLFFVALFTFGNALEDKSLPQSSDSRSAR